MELVSRFDLNEIKSVRIISNGSKYVREYRPGEKDQIFLSPDSEVKDLKKWRVNAERVSVLVEIIRELQRESDWKIEFDTWEE